MSNYYDNTAAWNTASTAISTAGNVVATGDANRRTLAYNKWALQQQRDWAIQDWEMQNAYNSPQAQMERLKAAGLNPHLVYGNGADAQGGIVRGTQTPDMKFQAPDFSPMGNMFRDYFAVKMMGQQVDNLQAQNDILKYQAEGIQLDNRKKEFDYGFKQETRPYDLQYTKGKVEQQDATIQKILADMDLNTSRYNITRDLASVQMRKDEQAILNMIEQNVLQKQQGRMNQQQMTKLAEEINNLKLSGRALAIANQIAERSKRLNLTPNDPAYMRLIMAVVDKLQGKTYMKE